MNGPLGFIIRPKQGTDKLTSQVEKTSVDHVILDHYTFPRRKDAQSN
jgi:hypothetical protein